VENSFDREKLKGKDLFVGTPMYGGQCYADFAFSIARLSSLCTELGVNLRCHFHCQEALIMRARNATVDEFLRSGHTHLIFIDADMGFDPRDVLQLLAMQDSNPAFDDFDVIAAPYPLKQIAWDNVARAVKMGAADGDRRNLEKYASRIALYPVGSGSFPLRQPLEVKAAGTGFMMIRRATFDRFRAAWPALAFTPADQTTNPGTEAGDFAFFDTAIDSKTGNVEEEMALFLQSRPDATRDELVAFLTDPSSSMKRYSNNFISEDYMFCKRVREADMRLWTCPWIQLTHTGNHTFSSSLPHVNALHTGG